MGPASDAGLPGIAVADRRTWNLDKNEKPNLSRPKMIELIFKNKNVIARKK